MATQALPSYLSASTFTSVVGGVTQTGVATVVVTSVLPTQELPSYLSASTFTTTVDGVESTGTSLVGVPLTYIGPSIPLGPDDVWTFLGSTTPASLTSTSSTVIPSSSSTPSSSTSASITSGPVPTSSTISGSSSESLASSTTSPASTSSAAAGTVDETGLTTGQLIGIIIAAVVAALVIILLLLLCYYRRRRRRAEYAHPNMSEFVIVDSEGQSRLAGEGSPRPTGEEEDSFLRGSRSGETTNEMREIGQTARLVQNPSPTATEMTTGTNIPPEGVIPTALKMPPRSPSPPSGPKMSSPFFHASSSSLFYNPTRGPDQSLVGAAVGAAKRDSATTHGSSASTAPNSPANGNAGKIISPQQLMQMDDQWQGESNGGRGGVVGFRRGPSELGERTRAGSPLQPPPTFDTSSSRQDSSMRTLGSHPELPGSDDGDERTTLLMAHRFNMSHGGPAVLVQSDNETSSPSSWRSSLAYGLQGLRLSRLSWFQRMNANREHSPSSAMPTTRSGTPSHPPTRPPSQLIRSADTRASLVVPRPLSHLTTSSTGDTMYYDAPSGPSTMSTRSGNGNNRSFSPPRPTSMPPLPPRAMVTPEVPESSSAPQSPQPYYDNGSERSSSFNRPALLLLDPPSGSAPGSPRFPTPPPPVPAQQQVAEARTKPSDMLDTPVPPRVAVSPFSTTSTRGGPVIPPGLEHLANVHSWRDSSSDMPSSATFGTHSDRDVNMEVIGSEGDVLEEAPPLPASNWMQLRAVTVADAIASQRSRRTLGQVEIEDQLDDIQSARASLHSIPDRLSPLSPLASGSDSRAPSRANNSSLGSSSSQLHGRNGNGSGNGTSGSSRSQLGHSNSITSDGRRRPRREPGEPLGLSPSSSSHFGRARLSAIGGHRTPITTPQRSPGPDATFAQGSVMHDGTNTGAIIGQTT
ncbi:hypothetical protein ACEPAG_7116 [Sanghuangporus baumii]